MSKLPNILTNADLLSKVPSAFAESPISRASTKYQMVKTSALIEELLSKGWFPVEANQTRTTSSEKMGKQFHIIKMEHNDLQFSGDERFQLMISNGHDLVTPLKIRASIFRKVCSNGLIAGVKFIPEIRMTHVSSVRELAHESINQVGGLLEKVKSSVEIMKMTPISPSQAHLLATKAYGFRHENEVNMASVEELLTPRRDVDDSQDLWTVYNVIQENLINGNYHYPVKKKENQYAMYRSQEIQSVSKNVNINSMLFDEAFSLVAS